jgi:hypothetical protein
MNKLDQNFFQKNFLQKVFLRNLIIVHSKTKHNNFFTKSVDK